MREKEIEKKLIRAVSDAGGICPKLTSPSFDGMPDRMVLLPGGRSGFVEVKAPGKSPGLCSFPVTACCDSLASKCMCWTMRGRLEGS